MVKSEADTSASPKKMWDIIASQSREIMSLIEKTCDAMWNTPEKPLDRMLYLTSVPP